ncbi:GSCFA domain-containing protein [Maribacter sp. 4G9]|nr:GSCFA domain-containing protein [Maribacter sp. 4G9]
MKLQTQIPLFPSENQIKYSSRIMLLGSCFSENIGKKLEYYKFKTLQNPFGILFHPLAIENLIQKALDQYKYSEEDIFQLDGRWHCFDAHSELSSGSKEVLLKKLNDALMNIAKALKEASHIMITLGTAWVYEHKERNAIVANCHKVPQKEFRKKLLSQTEVKSSLIKTIESIKNINPKAQIIFTISPVRHLKDGFVENQRSKAHLIAAVHEVLDSPSFGGGKGEAYFPSYEIMMDELRDYRFYERDMVHPNRLAIDYIWEKFMNMWISKEEVVPMEKVSEIQKGLAHRPFDPESDAHKKFVKSLAQKITYIKERYPFLNFDDSNS